MDPFANVFDLDAIHGMRRARTRELHTVLTRPAGERPAVSLAADDSAREYVVAHHLLEGAERAARSGDQDMLDWYISAAQHAPDTPPDVGQVVLTPTNRELLRDGMSETPYILIGPDTEPAEPPSQKLVTDAFHLATEAGFGELLAGHAIVVCLLRAKRLGDTLDSWTISRLPGTVFTDHVDEPLVLARDLIHEAGHNWLNDALTALGIKITDDAQFYSPWKQSMRPAFGFIHACWAFPLTVIYTARALHTATGPVRTYLQTYLEQQRRLLAAADENRAAAADLLPDAELRRRLDLVWRTARSK